MAECPSRNSLLNYLKGRLNLERREYIEAHVECCPGCEAILERLADLERGGHDDADFPVAAKMSLGDSTFEHVTPPENEKRVLAIGERLSRYDIIDKLGSGGMGEVYVAEDTQLGRRVALKVLPIDVATAERRKRFQREAKALAGLNHPNIVQIYSVEEEAGVPFITMELVAGKPLTQLIPPKGLSLDRFFEIAVELTDAVSTSHESGIIHRDLKPQNIMVSHSGRVKVLDFGLAKLKRSFAVTTGHQHSTELTTGDGRLVGTVPYMSPEQAEGKLISQRSDNFSIGVVLYEMATGRRPFIKDTSAALLASIISDTPDPITTINPDLPAELQRIVKRCLEKDPERRVQTAKDIRNLLHELKCELETGEATTPVISPRRRRFDWSTIFATAGLTAILVSIAWQFGIARRPDLAEPILRLANPVRVTSAIGVEDGPTWSPDGLRLAYEYNPNANTYVGDWGIYVTQIEGGVPSKLATNGPARYPRWSPDGNRIAFLSRKNGVWGLYTMSGDGGSLRHLAPLPQIKSFIAGGPHWFVDGTEARIVVRQGDAELSRTVGEIVDPNMLKSQELELPSHEGNYLTGLCPSPAGRFIAYIEEIFNAFNGDVSRLWLYDRLNGKSIPVTDGTRKVQNPMWSKDATQLCYISNRGGAMDIWQQPIGKDGVPEGEARQISAGLGVRSAAFSSDESKIAYSRGRTISNIWRIPINHDQRMKLSDAEKITFDHAYAQYVDTSPDGRHLVFDSDRAGNKDLWILPTDGGPMTQLTFNASPDDAPKWSPDGKEIAFRSNRSGNPDIWIKPVDGGPARQLTFDPAEDSVPAWTRNGESIVFVSRRDGTRDIWQIAAEGGMPQKITAAAGSEYFPTYSSDGTSLLFQMAGASGTRFFRKVAEGAPEPIGDVVGQGPVWSPDEQWIYYTGWDEDSGNLWAVSLEDGQKRCLTDFRGLSGNFGWGKAVDAKYIYFTWWEDLGDIWVMDVVRQR